MTDDERQREVGDGSVREGKVTTGWEGGWGLTIGMWEGEGERRRLGGSRRHEAASLKMKNALMKE